MKNDTSGTFWRSAMVLIASVFALMMLASGNAALAGDDDSDSDSDSDRVTVSGNSTACFGDGCGGRPDADLYLNMTGSLNGILSIFANSFECEKFGPFFDRYIERGKEFFVGTLNDEPVEFRTKYIVEGIYAVGFCDSVEGGAPAFELQLAGGCEHKLRGDVEGRLTFWDFIPATGSGATNFYYHGDDLEIDH